MIRHYYSVGRFARRAPTEGNQNEEITHASYDNKTLSHSVFPCMPLYVTPSVLLDVETQATHDVTIILCVFNYFSSQVGMVNSCNYCNTHKLCQNSLWGRSQTEAPCLLNSSNADPEYQSALTELQIVFALFSEP